MKIKVSEIQFIEADGSYVKIVTESEQFSLAQNLSQFQRKNPLASMIRVHRSFIVNFELIDSFDNSHIYIGKIQVPIGRTFRENFFRSANFKSTNQQG